MNYGDSARSIAERPSPANVAHIQGRSLPHSITTVAIVDNTQTASNPQPYGNVAKHIADAYRAALGRAHTNRMHIERDATDPMVYHAPSTSRPDHEPHTVTFVGPRWSDWTCSCEAGQHGRICLHVAGAVWLRKYRMSSVTFKPLVQPAKEVASPAIAESTPAEVAQSEAIKAEIIASLSDYPRGSRADIAQVEAEADYYAEVARQNAVAYAQHTFVPGTNRIASSQPDPFADFGYAEVQKEAWL